MTATYEAIATTTLGSAQASVTISNIPGTFTDLILIIQGTAANDSNGNMRFNGDTGTNYSWTRLSGNGSTASSARESNSSSIQAFTTGTGTGGRGNAIIHIQNYSNTTTYKTSINRHGTASIVTRAIVGLWRSTAAITSITVLTDYQDFDSGSSFTLYGIKAE